MGGWQTKQSPSPGHLHHIEMWCAEHSCYIDLEGMNFDSLKNVVLFCKVSRMVAQKATLSRWRKLTEWTFLHPNSLDRPAGVGALGIRTNEFSYQLSQFHNFNGSPIERIKMKSAARGRQHLTNYSLPKSISFWKGTSALPAWWSRP